VSAATRTAVAMWRASNVRRCGPGSKPASTNIDTVEEFEADEVRGLTFGRYLSLVRYRVLFVTTIYTEVVRRLDRHTVARGDESINPGE
jgi:hypothetical protein